MVPQAKIGIGHGRMSKDELEKVMQAFVDKEYDILLGKKSKLRNQINKIDNALKILSETELEIIKLRYFNPIPWDNVSSKVGYSKGHCKSLRVKAINKIKSLI